MWCSSWCINISRIVTTCLIVPKPRGVLRLISSDVAPKGAHLIHYLVGYSLTLLSGWPSLKILFFYLSSAFAIPLDLVPCLNLVGVIPLLPRIINKVGIVYCHQLPHQPFVTIFLIIFYIVVDYS